jgi:tRNA pseudouridine13 synthase
MTAATAWGGAVGQAQVGRLQRDFYVNENLGFTADGEGPHLLVGIEKTGLSSTEAIKAVARFWDIAVASIGYAGRKDRHAHTHQFITVPWPVHQSLPAIGAVPTDQPQEQTLRITQVARHRRKLRVGALKGNTFRLHLREVQGSPAAFETRLGQIARAGVPNYFGAQRFGRGGENLPQVAAWFAGKRRPRGRNERSMLLSAARSACFNQVLSARVQVGDWNTINADDRVMLDGRGSHFSAAEENLRRLSARAAGLRLHPTGPLPGCERSGLALSEGLIAREQALLVDQAHLVAGIIEKGVAADRRALRLAVGELGWVWPTANELILTFSLPRGAYATTVLRELIDPVFSA